MEIELKKNQIRIFTIDISRITEEQFKKSFNIQSKKLQEKINKYELHADKLHALCSFLLKKQYSGMHFSVSHSNKMCAIAVSKEPIGFDLEHYDAKKNFIQLAAKVMPECSVKTAKQFYKFWTIKEAAMKCHGGALLPLMKETKLSSKFIQVRNKKFNYWARSFSKYCFAIASQSNISNVQIKKIKNLP